MPIVRDATDADLPAVQAIYGHHVLHGTGTFETEPPTVEEMARRRAEVLGRGLPWLVLSDGTEVLGFAYCNWFKPRPAYRFSAEDSIYLRHGTEGRGLGRQLLGALCERAQAAGMRRLIAIIGDAANHGSIGVHRACGFTPAGHVRACGWKFGRWLDIVIMERPLGPGDSLPPEGSTG